MGRVRLCICVDYRSVREGRQPDDVSRFSLGDSLRARNKQCRGARSEKRSGGTLPDTAIPTDGVTAVYTQLALVRDRS